ncbi:hypothetical protein Rs2_42776 [Raphanus sativus]|nr:hypothetical protein Rs2_42776 [Raphanus sativus]
MLTRYVERSLPILWHASESLRLDRFRRIAAGATPTISSFAGALKPTSFQRIHHRSLPPCFHAGEFTRTLRSPLLCTISNPLTRDSRTLAHFPRKSSPYRRSTSSTAVTQIPFLP